MMKVNVEDISGVKKKVNIEIPEDQVTQEINSIYEDLKKKAKIKGFRPGKVPREILERYFKDYVKGEALQKLIQDTMPKAFEDSNLHPVSAPVIDPQELEIGKPFQYSAIVETKPDFKMEGYFGLKIEGKKEEVKDEEVEERLKGLQNLYCQFKDDSRAQAHPERGFCHPGLRGDAGRASPWRRERPIDFTVEVGSGRFIPGLRRETGGFETRGRKGDRSLLSRRLRIQEMGREDRFVSRQRSKRSKRRSFLPG